MRPKDQFSLDRISKLVSDLEQELARAPAGQPHLDELRAEVAELKQTLNASAHPDEVAESLHNVRGKLSDVAARAEGEVLKDTPYLAEIGRILGLV